MSAKAVKVPESLPHCQLVEALVSKANSRHDVAFNFIGNLESLREAVVPIVGQINTLFPEYTPHDENYHLKNLFHIADLILGDKLIESMNCSELFILACCLYAHDWGMALSQNEKSYVVTGQNPGMTSEELGPMKWDRESFIRFISSWGNPSLANTNNANDIDLDAWREYVRQSHATRSGQRAFLHFMQLDSGVALAIKRVCESHGLEFSELEGPQYPSTSSVLRETVNLRALAVYLRLIDLFDLGHDRTPFILWKYVMPRNSISKMEWAKHKALEPITCPPYQLGRAIRVDGSTNDHEVWAALEDLRHYCEDQLARSNDVVSRMKDIRHALDVFALDWHVESVGFSPISIKFEFDRDTMFEILSREIYKGDCYVFLRELLQNSIDAIRFRRAIIQSRQGFEPTNLGEIRVQVEHQDNGDATVTWRDDGIGMDEYIVKNYFSVAGKSYYRSSDFEREGVRIDPVSRFGIGILSCFMAADCIEISTYKDPYMLPTARPLRISIPAMNRQFRIEVLEPEGTRVGTTVKVHVKGDKVRAHTHDSSTLDVTSYLSLIAGFVEYPILIEDAKKKTLIIHPFDDVGKARTRFGDDWKIQQLNLSYGSNESFAPQDEDVVAKTLTEVRFDLNKDLGLAQCEGVMSYPVPSESTTDFSGHGLDQEVEIIAHKDPNFIGRRLRRVDRFVRDTLPSRSATRQTTSLVFKDGILVPQGFGELEHNDFIRVSRLWINIIGTKETRLDISRSEIVQEKEIWTKRISESLAKKIIEQNIEHLLEIDPSERMLELARISLFHGINPQRIAASVPRQNWPVPFLVGNKINIISLADLPETILCSPSAMREEIAALIESHFSRDDNYKGILSKWESEPCLAMFYGVKSISVNSISDCYSFLLGDEYKLSCIRFLRPPWNGDPPLLQKVYERFEVKEYGIKELLSRVIDSPPSLEKGERIFFQRELRKFLELRFLSSAPEIIKFPSPFNQSYAYGEDWINLNNEAASELLKIFAKIMIKEVNGDLSPLEFRQLKDASRIVMKRMPNQLRHSQQDYLEWVNELEHYSEFVEKLRIAEPGESRRLTPSFEEFVPGSFAYLDIQSKYSKPTSAFGEEISMHKTS